MGNQYPGVLAWDPRANRRDAGVTMGRADKLSVKTAWSLFPVIETDREFLVATGNSSQSYEIPIANSENTHFSYGGSGGFTPNVGLSFGPEGSDTAFWTEGYGDLENILFEDRDGFGQLEVIFTADENYRVSLHRWDMARYGEDLVINRVEILDGEGAVLWSESNVTIPGIRHRRFDFSAAPFEASTIILRFDSITLGRKSNDVALANILIAQR